VGLGFCGAGCIISFQVFGRIDNFLEAVGTVNRM